MSMIDISKLYTKEIITTPAGRRLCVENPYTDIHIQKGGYTVISQTDLTRNISFEKILFYDGETAGISLGRKKYIDYKSIHRIQQQESGIRICLFPTEEINNVYEDSEGDDSDTIIIPDSSNNLPAAPKECNHEIVWKCIPLEVTRETTMDVLSTFMQTYQEQFQNILNYDRSYIMTLQYPRLNSEYDETRLIIDEVFHMENNIATYKFDTELEDRINDFKDYSIQRSIISYAKTYRVPKCSSLFDWLKYRFLNLPSKSVAVYHGKHKSFVQINNNCCNSSCN